MDEDNIDKKNISMDVDDKSSYTNNASRNSVRYECNNNITNSTNNNSIFNQNIIENH